MRNPIERSWVHMHATAPPSNLRKRKKPFNSNRMILFFMGLPCLLLLLVFCYVPVWGWIYAFFHYKVGLSLANSEFTGFKYFVDLFATDTNSQLLPVLRNTLVFSFLGLILSPLPMIAAIIMSEWRFPRFQKGIQVATTLPNFISFVIIYSFTMAFFKAGDGVISNALINIGVFPKGYNLMSDPNMVYVFQTLLGLWKGLGYSAIIYYASIAGIDPELYDAASVDGANPFQRIWHIKVPGLMPTFQVLLLLAIGSLLNNGFEQYYVYWNAAVNSTITVLDLYVYRIGIGQGDFSLATAVGMFKTLISVILLFTANFASKRMTGNSIV